MSRTALVTGASSGIGAAVAQALVKRGWRVFGTSRDPDAVSDRIPGVEYLALDLTDEASIVACAAAAGEVDVLVNNAGESQSGPIEELPMEAVERLFRVNVFGAVRLTQLLLPGMRERGYGRVIMVGSMLASFPLAYRSSYVATKAAIKVSRPRRAARSRPTASASRPSSRARSTPASARAAPTTWPTDRRSPRSTAP